MWGMVLFIELLDTTLL